ncbi:unnamed protein product, partial [Mycena citricolor]
VPPAPEAQRSALSALMPTVPSVSPATGQPTTPSFIHTIDCNFVDNAGRTLLLRGINLSGSSKAPVGSPSYSGEGFWDTAEAGGMSFVGRPLNLDDGSADVHLARLQGWGFNLLRFPVTWEALEHEGPGKYDFEFMDYTVRVLRKCKEYGFRVYMDPHQDTWSRFSGGSGAPFWTLAACGINPRNITATQAAIIHCEYPQALAPDPASLPAMIWSTNYGRLLSQTLFTLFFAGRDFAPKCIIDGQNIQDYLQSHYIAAMGLLADRIALAGDLVEDCVIGWDSMNEPAEGLCGWKDLNLNPPAQGSTLKKGSYPTPIQSFRLGMGQAQTTEHWIFGTFGPSRDGNVTIDPKGRSVWADPGDEPDGRHPIWGWRRSPSWPLGICIWALHGVWDVETGFLMLPQYFLSLPGEDSPVEFLEDYWKPHFLKFGERIRNSQPEAILFVQPPVFAQPPSVDASLLKGRCAYAPHYYDGLTLITRHWNWFNADALGLLRGKYSSTLQAVKIGSAAIRNSLREQLGILKADSQLVGPYPTVLGEIGTPMDMDGKRAYYGDSKGRGIGDYSQQEKALDASLNGADGVNSLNWTMWSYCPDSVHEWGDGWNMEDLSVWSFDDLPDSVKRANSVYGMGAGSAATLGGGYGSEAPLIMRKKTGSATETVRTAATSSVSLTSMHATKLVGGPEGAGWRPGVSSYEFLTAGARAVRAFCRPRPVKVVGVIKDMSFDIASSELKVVVSVGSNDTLPDDELATEIFVPLVHYPHPALLDPSAFTDSVDSASIAEPTQSLAHERSTSEKTDAGMSPEEMERVPVLPSETMTASTSSAGTVIFSAKDMTIKEAAGRPLVDLDVSVSGGRWAVKDQILRWWYPVPSDGQADETYTITIRRRGGAVNVASELGWADTLCPEGGPGCVIM